MDMINVTDIRKNKRGILSEVVNSKRPVVILQRSKPVAYLIDAESFERMQSGEVVAERTGEMCEYWTWDERLVYEV